MDEDIPMFNMELTDLIAPLLQKSVNEQPLSEQELLALESWKSQSAENRDLFDRLNNSAAVREALKKWISIERNRELNKQRGIRLVAETIFEANKLSGDSFPEQTYQASQPVTEDNPSRRLPPVHRIHFLRAAWFRYAAAILILFGIAAYFYLKPAAQKETLADKPAELIKNDVPPGGDRAMLTLADGSTILLDSASNGALAQQGKAQIVKLADGKLVYRLNGRGAAEIMINTMTTPKGGNYQLTLPDGSRVWLNAASSITYPTAFTGSERKVTITGEVYFEVAKNPNMPFKVKFNKSTEIEVLGTHFNVNAYADEDDIRTTLLEGAVKINHAGVNKVLAPGQQSVLSPNGEQKILSRVDTSKIISWKEGMFRFRNDDLSGIMRQLSRWYDIEVKSSNVDNSKTYSGSIRRAAQLSQVFNILHEAGVVYSIDGRTVNITNN